MHRTRRGRLAAQLRSHPVSTAVVGCLLPPGLEENSCEPPRALSLGFLQATAYASESPCGVPSPEWPLRCGSSRNRKDMEYSPSKEAPGWAWTSGQPDTGACFHNVSSSLPVGKAIRGRLEAHSLEGALGWGCTLTL